MRQHLGLRVIDLDLRLHLDVHVTVVNVLLAGLHVIRQLLQLLLELLATGAQVEAVLLQDYSVTASGSDNNTVEELLYHDESEVVHQDSGLDRLLRDADTDRGLLTCYDPQYLLHLALAVHLLLRSARHLSQRYQVKCHQLADKEMLLQMEIVNCLSPHNTRLYLEINVQVD